MRNKRKKSGFTLIELLFVFMAVAFVLVLMVPVIKVVRNYKTKSMCAENVRQIGLAMYIYAQEHNGKFPQEIDILYSEKYLTNENLLDCPATKEKGSLKSPEYLYAGGLSVNSQSSDTLVMDKEDNHLSRGKNVLHVNGVLGWEK